MSSLHPNGKPHVMVVDDDPGMCRFLESFLAERGYHAVTVAHAKDAVQHYLTERPAAVILDMEMPGGMDGLEALAAFKQIDHDVPVIVVSGEDRVRTVVQAMQLGAWDYVSKPFEVHDLEVPLTRALGHGHAAMPAADAGHCSLKDISRAAARAAERELIARALQRTRWNRKEAAVILGISYKALLYKIKGSGLAKPA